MLSNKAGFILAEALIGLCLFSLMLGLYLPTMYQSLAKVRQAKQMEEAWYALDQLCQIAIDQDVSDQKDSFINAIIVQFEQDTQLAITDVSLTEKGCEIDLSDGRKLAIWQIQ
ncbi:hypothetical protein [Vaginisenegalia massiliensis]|uniref:hypothetical protein n=1 Tax=Vaginisenegalia massiliensis TaxID=2058294 RepID=UPI0013DDFB2B|nr:hypothetical protein [Vaginisenegalia massiliensis]